MNCEICQITNCAESCPDKEKSAPFLVNSNSLLEESFNAWKEYTCAPDDFETYERWINTKPDFVHGNWGVNMSQAQYFHAGFIAASNITHEPCGKRL